MKTSVTKSFTVDAAHHLPGHKGACKNLHGHTYRIEVTVARECQPKLIDHDMVIDFSDLKEIVDPLIKQLDHCNLNDLDQFADMRPTAENMAMWLFDQININLIKSYESLSHAGYTTYPEVSSVRIFETPTSWATYPAGK